jgi:hypothetical protein
MSDFAVAVFKLSTLATISLATSFVGLFISVVWKVDMFVIPVMLLVLVVKGRVKY